MAQRPRPGINEKLGDYYTMTNEVLGQGYFAVVKVGIDKTTGERVAIKVVNKELVEREETLNNEIDILSKVDHENIVRMHAIFDTEEHLFIVMELMEGGELYEEIIQRSVFSEKDSAVIVKQLLEALTYLHAQGIVHRDLKLENLLLHKKGELTVKLADFGLSRLFKPGSQMYTACGTPFYVAPDILLATDESGYGPNVDMWAVGVLLYILLSGRLPFSGDNDDDLFRAIMEGDLVWKSPQFDEVSEEAKDLISHLIVVDTDKRYNAEQALQHPFIQNNNNTKPLHNTFSAGLKELSNFSKTKAGNKDK
jgi:serine/threonine protein kinase